MGIKALKICSVVWLVDREMERASPGKWCPTNDVFMVQLTLGQDEV